MKIIIMQSTIDAVSDEKLVEMNLKGFVLKETKTGVKYLIK